VITQTGTGIPAELALPTGTLRQRPPAYSAVHVDGERAYERARRGETVVVPEREVTVYAFDELWREGDRAAFRIVCSSGTYVRSLIGDLGDAYTEELRRTRVGALRVEDADPERVVALGDALGFFASVTVDGDLARRAASGAPFEPPRPIEPPRPGWELPLGPQEVLVLDPGGPVALAQLREDGLLKPVVGFRA